MRGIHRKGVLFIGALAIVLLALALARSTQGVSRAAAIDPAMKKSQALAAGSSLFKNAAFEQPFQQGDGPGVDPELVRELKRNARGEASVQVKSSTGQASFVRVGKGGDLLPQDRSRTPQGKAVGFFAKYGELFGVMDAGQELVETAVYTDPQGGAHVSYQQVHAGVPVFAAVLKAHTDADANLTGINGVFVPGIRVDTTPRLSESEAAAIALADVLANPPEDDADALLDLSAGDLRIGSNRLYVYRDGLIQNVPGPDYLVYEVEVTNDSSLRDFVYVDAHSGKIVNRISTVHTALFRRLFEQSTANQVWQEGDPFPGVLNQDQQNIVNFSGDSYYYFFNAFGVDSYDQAGAEMQSVNNDPRISCPNANWNGLTTNYCNGVTADDVVAHEWGHAYTDYTSDLIYQWQPGALNESYSDIWGETVDMLNGAGTDAPADVRSEEVCSAFTAPLPVLRINSPASIAGEYAAGAAQFGPPVTAAGLTGDVVLADDGVDIGTDACTPLVNAAAIAGNLALVDRGACAFTIKVKNAQDAGAIGVIVADNVPGPAAGMGGADPTIVIPSVRVTLDTGNLIKAALPGVNATLKTKGAAPPESSYRWLMGEDATAFGSAIRDMWSPTCLADPGKVTDAEYVCTAADSGGVHSNSGVPNHGFALLVDGGSYNGYNVPAIGLVKAAHLYWRAQAVYQTPTTNFNDHADALEAACTDLTGVPLEGLSTSTTPAGPSGEAITPADCAAVTTMIAAVELRTDVTAQCNFQPILAKDPPAFCSDTPYQAASVFQDDFEGGLGGWTLSNQGVFSGWPGLDWTQASSLPGGRPGAAAFGIDPGIGNCDAGDGDVSGVMRMESPAIQIPANALTTPRMAFDHYIATEQGWDGGNLKISVNGGPYAVVPSSAFTYNPYNQSLNSAAQGNTNPLAGQPGFTGTDGGEVGGSWGQSQIDLVALGVAPGDTVRLRYDMGIDGCTGIDGWYVDDFTVYSCEIVPPDCSAAYASPSSLWPPNHMFQPIDVLGVTDPNGEAVQITIQSIFQDEAVDARDSGNTSPDGSGVGTSTAEVRAERVESGNGRVYYIDFLATNASGGTCTGTVEVGVPVNRGDTPVGDGPLYDSTMVP